MMVGVYMANLNAKIGQPFKLGGKLFENTSREFGIYRDFPEPFRNELTVGIQKWRERTGIRQGSKLRDIQMDAKRALRIARNPGTGFLGLRGIGNYRSRSNQPLFHQRERRIVDFLAHAQIVCVNNDIHGNVITSSKVRFLAAGA